MGAAEDLIRARDDRLRGRVASLGRGFGARKPRREGSLVRMVGMKLEAEGCDGAIGERCRVTCEGTVVDAEIVGFAEGRLVLMPEGDIAGLQLGARVQPLGERAIVGVDEQLFGRVLDGSGHFLDGLPAPHCSHSVFCLQSRYRYHIFFKLFLNLFSESDLSSDFSLLIKKSAGNTFKGFFATKFIVIIIEYYRATLENQERGSISGNVHLPKTSIAIKSKLK